MIISRSVKMGTVPPHFDIYDFSDLQKVYGSNLTILTNELYSVMIGKEFYFMVGSDLFYDQRTYPEHHIMRGLGECINGGSRQIRNLSYHSYRNSEIYHLASHSTSLLGTKDFEYVWVFLE